MKKTNLVLVMVLGISTLLLTGCDNEDAYKHDIREIKALKNQNDVDVETIVYGKGLEDLEDIVDSLDMETSEGKTLKKDYEEFYDIMKDYKKAVEKEDEDKVEKIVKELDDLYEELDEHLEKFVEEANDAGVDDADELVDLFQ